FSVHAPFMLLPDMHTHAACVLVPCLCARVRLLCHATQPEADVQCVIQLLAHAGVGGPQLRGSQPGMEGATGHASADDVVRTYAFCFLKGPPSEPEEGTCSVFLGAARGAKYVTRLTYSKIYSMNEEHENTGPSSRRLPHALQDTTGHVALVP